MLKAILTPIGFICFFGVIALLIFFSFSLDRVLKFPVLFPHPLNWIFGLLFSVIGVIPTAISVIYFIIKKGTPVPVNPPSKLIVKGIYKYVRNPMLTGLFIQMFGLGIICDSISLIFITTPVFTCLSVWLIKNIEEPELAKRFGNEYLEYKKRIPRFFPWNKKSN